MDQLLKEKIGRHQKELSDSDLSPETKERLSHFVDKVAFTANGCPDKIAALTDLVADLCLMKVEDRVRQPAERKALITAEVSKYEAVHNSKCPFMGAIKGKLGLLYVFRWPLTVCVGFVSAFPNGPAIIQALRQMWPG